MVTSDLSGNSRMLRSSDLGVPDMAAESVGEKCFLSKLVAGIGMTMGWMLIPVVCLVFSVAVLRYAFGIGYPWLSELYTWINGAAVMLAAAYTWQDDRQVRVAIFYERFKPRIRALVEVIGIVLILLPTLAIIAYWSWGPIIYSWQRLERSRDLEGLPGVFILKSVILVFCVLMALQAVLFLRTHLRTLFRGAPQPNDR